MIAILFALNVLEAAAIVVLAVQIRRLNGALSCGGHTEITKRLEVAERGIEQLAGKLNTVERAAHDLRNYITERVQAPLLRIERRLGILETE